RNAAHDDADQLVVCCSAPELALAEVGARDAVAFGSVAAGAIGEVQPSACVHLTSRIAGMTLILHHLLPIHWAVAGAAIAVITLALLFLANRRLGLSTGFEDICSLALPLPYFQRKAVVSGRAWRLPFIIGLLAGGFLSAVLGGGWSPTWQLGMFD